jgi:site-specific DNA-methyltransferase (adenine-specific)
MLKRNARQRMDGLTMLGQMADESAALAFCDPQHRTVLDKLKYGNEGERQKGRAKLPQMSDATICCFLDEIYRVLKPSSYCILWIDKFGLASGHFREWIPSSFKTVDLVSWDKMRIGMGKRLRCRTEFAVVLQKPPIRAKGTWTDHGIPDCWPEKRDIRLHPHNKPEKLTERLIKAITKPGDLVVDPCAGGYGVLEACAATGREFIGCDLI